MIADREWCLNVTCRCGSTLSIPFDAVGSHDCQTCLTQHVWDGRRLASLIPSTTTIGAITIRFVPKEVA